MLHIIINNWVKKIDLTFSICLTCYYSNVREGILLNKYKCMKYDMEEFTLHAPVCTELGHEIYYYCLRNIFLSLTL